MNRSEAATERAPRKRRTYPETEIQRALISWLELAHPDLATWTVHVPNQGTASRRRGGILQGMGAKAGFPDLVCFAPRGMFRGLALELKAPGKKPSDEQKEWLFRLKSIGWADGYVDSLELAQRVFDMYAKGVRP